MATRTALSLDQFRELPEREDGTNYELSQGELITLPHRDIGTRFWLPKSLHCWQIRFRLKNT